MRSVTPEPETPDPKGMTEEEMRAHMASLRAKRAELEKMLKELETMLDASAKASENAKAEAARKLLELGLKDKPDE